jgi:glutamyl-tRNA synthetase/nondiscriminating glutamyl-tRNA synthetase
MTISNANAGVRVRFAPSPTGLLHVGNARTALYNWLFARHNGGTFILRVEDTDVDRSEARYEAQLIADLRWLGLDWQEGPEAGGPHPPYRQSERLEIYQRHTDQLLREGKAYRCFCTQEELEAERLLAAKEHRPLVYSGVCRLLSRDESAARAAAGEPFAVRLQVPDRPLRFHDIVRGDVEFQAETVSDPILVRSGDGMPVYNYVVTIDDALMKITHVIRGDDHISNTPKQVAIYEAFGWKVPEFAHLSTILGSDRERLSKRHGATSVSSFREMGYLPEALVNYLALLGWGAEGGLRETFTSEELVKEFKLERVTPSPAIFDWDKLNWLNRHYLKTRPAHDVLELAWPAFAEHGWLPARDKAESVVVAWFARLLGIFITGVDRLDQLPDKTKFIFSMDVAAVKADAENAVLLSSENGQKVTAAFAERVQEFQGTLDAEAFKGVMNDVKAATGAKGKELFHPVRIMLTGAHSGPEFDKIVPLMEEGAALGLAVLSVRQRVEKWMEPTSRL